AGIQAAMSDNAGEVETGMAFLHNLVRRQVEAGAHFLDLNVDEISIRRKEQEAAMRWLVPTVAGMCDTPLSIDSSCIGTIAAGLEAAGSDRPVMLNSASLERLDSVDLAVQYNCHLIATAAGADGMPLDTEERVINASKVVEAAVAKGIPLDRIYVDPLTFPISVDAEFGVHCLEAIRQLREKFGPEIHITGGFSNVSFGIPMRRLVNDAFTNLAVEAGADSGIIDPVTSPLARVFSADRESAPYKLAENMLLGNDKFCKAYLEAFRAGELK
ncbi:MAG: dihydropteroate synthase, partial [Lentisphaeria bacterium]|nr:dihydropteroate synthase [Lentisphaeria bacterium]